MNNKNFIWITTRKEFMHKYPNAPEEVIFLRTSHRHIFHFKVYLEVTHDDRDVEFIMFKRKIDGYLSNLRFNIKSTSCETLSNYLYDYIKDKYPDRDVKIEVSEDGENGVEKYYTVNKS